MGNICNGINLTEEEKNARKLEKDQSRELDKKIRDESRQDSQVNKLLLLGAGESGKSTLFKQMVNIYQSGYNDEDRKGFIPIIHNNVLTTIRTLCKQCELISNENPYKLEDVVPCESQQELRMINECNDDEFTTELGEAIKKLWKDPGIIYTYENRGKFQLLDSAKYFLDKIDDISTPSYIPSEMDVLRSRARTTGIVENNFKIQDNEFKMFDVGGQRNERKKWIHCFENVTAVIFVAAISEYDQQLYEDETQNRMIESLNLFEEICNLKWFKNTSMILFLNKRDIFMEKIQKVSLRVCFGDEYDLNNFEDYSYEDGCYFLQYQFNARNEDPQKRQIYTQITTATDKGQIELVFKAVKDIVIRKSLNEAGLV